MPYNPGITDISGQLLAQGIQGAAQTYADSQEKMRLTDKEIAHLKGTVDFAASKNILTPDDLAQFNSGNLAKKREIASKAGMLYQDMQDEENRKALTLSPDEIANFTRAGMVPLRTSAKSFQAAPMPEAPFELSPQDAEAIKASGYLPVQTGKGRYDYLNTQPKGANTMQFDPARDVVKIPGTNLTFVRTSANGGGNVMPTGGAEAWKPTPAEIEAAGLAGLTYVATKGGMVPRTSEHSTAKPAPFRDVVDALYEQVGKPTVAQIQQRQRDILAAAGGDKPKEPWSATNKLGETRGQELQRLAQELKAATTSAAPVRAPAPSARPTVKPSAGKATANTGPTLDLSAAGLPEGDGLPQGEGDVLPPLPDEIPTVTPEEAAKLPKGAKFRTLDGRVMTKAN
jgi:hypothetical protein